MINSKEPTSPQTHSLNQEKERVEQQLMLGGRGARQGSSVIATCAAAEPREELAAASAASAPSPEAAAAGSVAVCPACTFHNPRGASSCEVCGAQLN